MTRSTNIPAIAGGVVFVLLAFFTTGWGCVFKFSDFLFGQPAIPTVLLECLPILVEDGEHRTMVQLGFSHAIGNQLDLLLKILFGLDPLHHMEQNGQLAGTIFST